MKWYCLVCCTVGNTATKSSQLTCCWNLAVAILTVPTWLNIIFTLPRLVSTQSPKDVLRWVRIQRAQSRVWSDQFGVYQDRTARQYSESLPLWRALDTFLALYHHGGCKFAEKASQNIDEESTNGIHFFSVLLAFEPVLLIVWLLQQATSSVDLVGYDADLIHCTV